MKRTILLIFIFLISLLSVNASKLDSLQTNYYKAETDSARLASGIALARTLFKASKYDSAYYYFQIVFELAKSEKQTKQKLNIMYMMANVNYWMGYHSVADSIYSNALGEAYQMNDSALISKIHTSIGPNKLKMLDTLAAIQSLELALKMCVEEGIKGNIYANLGQIEREHKKYEASLNYFDLSGNIWKELGLTGHEARVLFEKGRVYMAKKDFKAAISYIQQSLILDSINPYETVQSWKYKRLSESFLQLGKYDSAYFNLEKHYNMQNKIYNEGRDKTIKDIEQKYQTKLKDQENAKLKSDNILKAQNIETKNILLYSSVSLLALILLFVSLLLKGRKRLSKALALQEEQKKRIQVQSDVLQEANDELRDLSKYKETLSSMLVHDLSNPLHVIKSSTTDDNIISHADHMITMVDNILTIQKFEDKNMALDLFEYQLINLSEKAIKQTFVEARRRNVTVSNYIPANIFIEVDSLLLVRVFVNLISNALRFTPSNGKVILKAEPLNENTIHVKVIDTGVGISKEDLSLIFDKYGQSKSGSKNKKQNYGLGLSFCKLAIESMSGKISVDSKEQVGTEFSFTLKGYLKSNVNPFPIDKSTYTVNHSIRFTKEECKILKPYFETLRTLEIYELTEIRKVLGSIKKVEGQNIKDWLVLFENAIYNSDIEQYLKLTESLC